jgi:hypothetical protein
VQVFGKLLRPERQRRMVLSSDAPRERYMGDETVLKTSATQRIRERVDPIGHFLAEGFHFLGLFAIGGATVWAAVKAFFDMVAVGTRISPRPPHRSRRALLTHRAPPLGFGVEAVAWQRV